MFCEHKMFCIFATIINKQKKDNDKKAAQKAAK